MHLCIFQPSAGEPLSLPNSLEQPSDALLTTALIDLASTVPTPQTSMNVTNMSSSTFDTPRDPFSPMRLVVKYKQKELHDAMESQSEESHSRVIANDSQSVSMLLPELPISQPESMMSSSNIEKVRVTLLDTKYLTCTLTHDPLNISVYSPLSTLLLIVECS